MFVWALDEGVKSVTDVEGVVDILIKTWEGIGLDLMSYSFIEGDEAELLREAAFVGGKVK